VHHNRDHRRSFLSGPSRGASVGNEHVHLLANEFSRESTQIRIVLGGACLDVYRLPVNIIEVVETRAERVKQGIWAEGGRQPAYVDDFVRFRAEALLRAQDKRSGARD